MKVIKASPAPRRDGIVEHQRGRVSPPEHLGNRWWNPVVRNQSDLEVLFGQARRVVVEHYVDHVPTTRLRAIGLRCLTGVDRTIRRVAPYDRSRKAILQACVAVLPTVGLADTVTARADTGAVISIILVKVPPEFGITGTFPFNPKPKANVSLARTDRVG